jgi:assimilatory nitrate reductase catalytic subunit
VGEKTLIQAIQKDGLHTVEDIGRALQAGTNCGSCKPELLELIRLNLKG